MSRSRHARPSKLVRREDLNKKKNSQLKKGSKPANKNVASVKTVNPGKLKQLIQERDVKKKNRTQTASASQKPSDQSWSSTNEFG